jgi:hypothetical protein
MLHDDYHEQRDRLWVPRERRRIWTPPAREAPRTDRNRVRCSPIGGFGFGSRATKRVPPSLPLDPATLSMLGYWRGSYTPANSNWVGTASLGASGSRDLAYVSGTINAGSAENGFTPLDSVSLPRIEYATFSDLFGANNAPYSGFILVRPDGVTTLARFWGGSAGGAAAPSLTVTSGVVKYFDNVDVSTVNLIAISVWVPIFFGFTGSNSWLKVGSDPRIVVASTTTAGRGGLPFRPFSNVGSDPYDGRCMEMGFTATQLTDTDTDNIRRYMSARYAFTV